MEDQQDVRDKDFYLKRGKVFTEKFAHQERRIEFRKYLDRTGFLDKVTEILMDLYEYPVVNYPTLDYVRMSLVVPNPDVEETNTVRPKLEEAKSFRDYLRKENDLLKDTFRKNNYTMPGDTAEDAAAARPEVL